ncbi:MAG: tetratricopeptide repeat protein [Planctomycetes bacterium]|nr:tetratricopeptide repeat protein [Planctomycetota bacterium]
MAGFLLVFAASRVPRFSSAVYVNLGALELNRVLIPTDSRGELVTGQEIESVQISTLELLRQAIKWNKENATGYRELGRAYVALGKADTAVESLEQAVAIEPGNSVLRYTLGNAYDAAGQREKAVEEWWRANVGDLFWARQEFDKAALIYELELEHNPDTFSYFDYMRLGDAWTHKLRIVGRHKKWLEKDIEQAGYIDWETAIFAYRRAVDLCSDSATAHAAWAFALYWGKQDFQRATQKLETAIDITALSEEQFWWALELGEWYRQNNQPQDALAWFDFARKLDPHNREPYVRRGLTYQKQLGMFDEAIAEFEIAIEKEPDSPHPYYHLGRVYQEMGDLEKSAEFYQVIVLMRPENEVYQELLEQIITALQNQ